MTKYSKDAASGEAKAAKASLQGGRASVWGAPGALPRRQQAPAPGGHAIQRARGPRGAPRGRAWRAMPAGRLPDPPGRRQPMGGWWAVAGSRGAARPQRLHQLQQVVPAIAALPGAQQPPDARQEGQGCGRRGQRRSRRHERPLEQLAAARAAARASERREQPATGLRRLLCSHNCCSSSSSSLAAGHRMQPPVQPGVSRPAGRLPTARPPLRRPSLSAAGPRLRPARALQELARGGPRAARQDADQGQGVPGGGHGPQALRALPPLQRCAAAAACCWGCCCMPLRALPGCSRWCLPKAGQGGVGGAAAGSDAAAATGRAGGAAAAASRWSSGAAGTAVSEQRQQRSAAAEDGRGMALCGFVDG